MTSAAADHPWREVEPLPSFNGEVQEVLENVDALRVLWQDSLSRASPDELRESRSRSLRRHAIETGIIERLYDLDWGVTEALVAEGITLEVAEREGGVSADALEAISSQFEGLEFLAEAARDGQELSIHFVRQLHQIITRHQRTFEARNDLGQIVEAPLRHGEWKMHKNHVRRPDGSLLEYTPPERVQDQMEALLREYLAMDGVHAVTRAAWLHHRFICIHPFEDGNGRVARAMSLLALLRSNYAPLVVDRKNREDYIAALDAANDGNLALLVRLFGRLELRALRSELERPATLASEGQGVLDVARAYADRLRVLQEASSAQRTSQTKELATAIHGRINDLLRRLSAELRATFREVDPEVRSAVASAAPPDPQAKHWGNQIIRSAREADFFTNLTEGSWWSRLHLTVLGSTLRYVAVVQRVGQGETGVLAVTMFAETLAPETEEGRPLPTPLVHMKTEDSVTLVYDDDPERRWAEVCNFVEKTLAAAIANYAQQLG